MLSDENLATNYLLSHQIQEALIQFYNLQTINIFTSPSSMLLCSQSFSSHDNPNKYLDKNQTDFHPVESLFFDWSAVSQAHAQLHIPGGIYLAQSKWWLIIGRVIFWTTNIRPSQEEDQYISSLTRQHSLVKQAKAGDEHSKSNILSHLKDIQSHKYNTRTYCTIAQNLFTSGIYRVIFLQRRFT